MEDSYSYTYSNYSYYSASEEEPVVPKPQAATTTVTIHVAEPKPFECTWPTGPFTEGYSDESPMFDDDPPEHIADTAENHPKAELTTPRCSHFAL